MTDTRKLIEGFMEALVPFNRDALMQVLTDDIVWNTPKSALAAFRGAQRGRDTVLRMISGGEKSPYTTDTRRIDVEFVVVDGERAAVQFRMIAATKGGEPYDNLYCITLLLRNDRICEAWEHLDTAYLYASLGLGLDHLKS